MITAAVTGRPVPGEVRRVLQIARILAFHWKTFVWTSLGMLGVVLVVLVLRATGVTDLGLTDGSTAIFAYCAGVSAIHLQAMTQTFPFLFGLGVTRRDFYLATLSVATVNAVVHAVVLTLLAQIELASGGWGLSTGVIAIEPLSRLSALEQWVALTAILAAMATAFVFVGAVYQRWGRTGAWVLGVAYVLLTSTLGVLVIIWFAVSDIDVSIVVSPPFALLAGGPLVLAVLLGLAGFAVLRRATP